MAIVGDMLALVAAELDDPDKIHTTEAVAIRALNRAQQWVCLAYKLLLQNTSVVLIAKQGLVHWPSIMPNVAGVVAIALNGAHLWPTPWDEIRLADPQWLATQGTPAHWYILGLTYVGVYPVASGSTTLTLTGMQVPTTLTAVGNTLQCPDAFLPQVVQVTTGLLMLGRERDYSGGLKRIASALGAHMQAQEIPMAPEPTGGA